MTAAAQLVAQLVAQAQLEPGDITAAVAELWELTGPLPVPRRPLVCPLCGSPAFPREWRIYRLPDPKHRRHAHRLPWRCDVSMKCPRCSAVWPHGLAITEADAIRFGAMPGDRQAAAYTWRQAAERLGAATY